MLKTAVPPGVIGTFVAVQAPLATVAFTPLIHREKVESLIVPLAVTAGCHNWSSGIGAIVTVNGFGDTVMLVTLVFPAASVTVNVKLFVPLDMGSFSTQKFPFRSTRPLTMFVIPLVPTICAVTVAVGSSTLPRQVKLLPLICSPFPGQ